MIEYTSIPDRIHVLRYNSYQKIKTIESVIPKLWWKEAPQISPNFTLYENKNLGASLFLVKDEIEDLITYEDLKRILGGESLPRYSFDSFIVDRDIKNISDIMLKMLGTSHTNRIEKYGVRISSPCRVETQKSDQYRGRYFDYWIVVYIPDNIKIVKGMEEYHDDWVGYKHSEYVYLYKNGAIEPMYYNADSNFLYTESGVVEGIQILRVEKDKKPN